MGAKIQGRGVSGTPVKFTGYLKNFPASAEAIRNALGKLQTTCFIISEPSETFKQPVSSFPSPRKPSNNLFRHFQALGNLQTTCFIISEASGPLRRPAKFARYGLLRYLASFPASAEAGGRRKNVLPLHLPALKKRGIAQYEDINQAKRILSVLPRGGHRHSIYC